MENSFESALDGPKRLESHQVSLNEENEIEEEDDDLNSINSECADELLEFYGELAHKSVKLNKDSLFAPGNQEDQGYDKASRE